MLARVMKLRDRRSEGKQNEITDMFLATAGYEEIQEVSAIAYRKNLEELTFKEIGEVMKRNIRPKKRLVIAERTTFLETRQHSDESIVQFAHRLKERARYCEFESITNNRTKEKLKAQTNTKFYENTVANGMSGKNNCPAFGKTCSIRKRKNHVQMQEKS